MLILATQDRIHTYILSLNYKERVCCLYKQFKRCSNFNIPFTFNTFPFWVRFLTVQDVAKRGGNAWRRKYAAIALLERFLVMVSPSWINEGIKRMNEFDSFWRKILHSNWEEGPLPPLSSSPSSSSSEDGDDGGNKRWQCTCIDCEQFEVMEVRNSRT